jgi:hypothetical protein
VYRWPVVGRDGLSEPTCNRAEVSVPEAQTHRSRRLHCSLDIDDINGSGVFFSIKTRVIRFFPRFCALESYLLLLQDAGECLQADGSHDLSLEQKATEFFKCPAGKRLP